MDRLSPANVGESHALDLADAARIPSLAQQHEEGCTGAVERNVIEVHAGDVSSVHRLHCHGRLVDMVDGDVLERDRRKMPARCSSELEPLRHTRTQDMRVSDQDVFDAALASALEADG